MRLIPVPTVGRDQCVTVALDNPNEPYNDKVWRSRDLSYRAKWGPAKAARLGWPIVRVESNVTNIRSKGRKP